MRLLFIPSLLFLSGLKLPAQEYFLLVGTYDSPQSEGIYIYRFDANSGATSPVSHFKMSNASYLALSPDEKFVYAVQETASKEGTGGKLLALSFDKSTASLDFLNEQHTWGDHPCFVSTDVKGKIAFVANYSGGSLALFPILPDGSAGPATISKQTGSGPHPRQKSSHVHAAIVSPDNQFVLTTNLGTDKIQVYSLDTANRMVRPFREMSSVPGSGPRIPCFDPSGRFVYVVEELSGTISMYTFRKGKLKRKQRLSTMIAGDTSFAGSAHISISADGKFLYASNRGTANNIAVYSINKKGKLNLEGHQPTGGLAPRHFSIDPTGNYLLAANQNSNEIVLFFRDPVTGLLTDSGKRISIGKPVCLQWARTASP